MTNILSKKDLKIFKGKYFSPWFNNNDIIHVKTPKKVVVFDLDETIGSFSDLYIIWCGIKHAWPSCPHFNKLLDMYPEFLRYGITTILEFLYEKKRTRECNKIYIYTNNQCSPEWVHLISKYFESKIRTSKKKLFDKMICAFKINNKTIEDCRSGHSKRIRDFLRCSGTSDHSEICFIDDVEYPEMRSGKVYYICPRPYVHPLTTIEIIKRISKASWLHRGILTSESFWKDWFRLHKRRFINKSRNNLDLDLQVSQKIIFHLQEYLMYGKNNQPKTQTKKKQKELKKKRKTQRAITDLQNHSP